MAIDVESRVEGIEEVRESALARSALAEEAESLRRPQQALPQPTEPGVKLEMPPTREQVPAAQGDAKLKRSRKPQDEAPAPAPTQESFEAGSIAPTQQSAPSQPPPAARPKTAKELADYNESLLAKMRGEPRGPALPPAPAIQRTSDDDLFPQ